MVHEYGVMHERCTSMEWCTGGARVRVVHENCTSMIDSREVHESYTRVEVHEYEVPMARQREVQQQLIKLEDYEYIYSSSSGDVQNRA